MMSTYCGLKTSCSGSGCSWLTNFLCVSFPRKYKPTRISGKLFSDGWNSLWLARVGTVVCWRDLCRMVQTLSQLGSVNSDCSWLSPCPEIGQRSCLFQGSILYSNAGQYRGGRNIWNCSHLASTGKILKGLADPDRSLRFVRFFFWLTVNTLRQLFFCVYSRVYEYDWKCLQNCHFSNAGKVIKYLFRQQPNSLKFYH